MANKNAVRLVDHSINVRNASEIQIKRALEEIGQACEDYAKLNISKNESIDTGNLRNSIAHKTEERQVTIGSDVRYSIYVEFGTGQYAEGGGGRQTPWSYKDAHGNWHRTNGQKPKPFLRPAVSDHLDEYRKIIKENLKK